ncbi:uncharacterized protein LOC131076467 isoform X2 [Cryptomeria japonica]|uniref:uncharacterized protein LOC131076467 isoform X2 n=1 Tax=Cryptomeria japonica TaxID=3369 RepID=UPI0027D9DB96|nr:uncharacterized protein LOC131076467 isoform X2 [Cryptomeria japonica]
MLRKSATVKLGTRLIRDVAFVIASPDLLLASGEFPTVSTEMLGGDTLKWKESKKWLRMLNLQHVTDWFEARKCVMRLGDHFAACIEYVLRFSPIVQVEQLVISQQVRQQVPSAGVQSFCQNDGTMFESNTLEPASQQSERPEFSTNRPDLSDLNILQMSIGDFNDPLMAKIDVNVAPSAGVHKQKKRLFRKMSRMKACKTEIRTIGEFDFLFRRPHFDQNASKQYTNGFGSIKKDTLELELPHKVVFEEEVHHWEASVKFLLYAGPWEAFGFESPGNATWRLKRLDGALEEGFLYEPQNQRTPANPSNLSKFSWENNEFLGCFLGPHVGETLYDRKCRLQNQLALSQNPSAASFLRQTYGISELPEQVAHTGHFSDKHTTEETKKIMLTENMSALKIAPGALLKGFLFYEHELWQLLRGSRRRNRPFDICGLCSRLTTNSSREEQVMDPHIIIENCSNGDAFASHETNYHCQCSCYKSESKLNPKHFMGWWTHIDKFAEFADHGASEKSRWYIIPKQEWLSPVIINGSDLEGSAKILTLQEFLAVAAEVAEEAALSEIPRKRRFMVAEVCWEAGFLYSMESQAQSQGLWIEASRGFVVEESWPDTRVYRPHGYVPDFSHGLQQDFK